MLTYSAVNPRGCFRLAVAFLLVSLCCPAAVKWSYGDETDSGKTLRAGASAIDITPTKLPVIVNGGMSERETSTVTDPLHARSLVLDDGATRIALSVVDSCVVPGALMDRAKAIVREKIGIPPDRILISATHSHSTPSVCSLLGSGQNDDYAEFLCQRIAEGIVAADARLIPARIGWAVGQDPKNVFCRRFIMKPGKAGTNPFGGSSDDQAQMNPGYQNPDALRRTGPADTEVSVLAVQTLEGAPIAVLGNYSTHYAGASRFVGGLFRCLLPADRRVDRCGGEIAGVCRDHDERNQR